jgi:hypothetical protein
MSIPQVPEQVKRAPTLALRAVFAGIGRILLSADRSQAQPAAAATALPQAPSRRQQRSAAGRPDQGSRWRSLDQTGNVRLLSDEDVDDDESEAAAPPVTLASEPAAPWPAAPWPAAARPAADLPLAGYDELSLPSIRARLRTLDLGQLRVLLEHEVANAERPEVIGMFERRIDKLESGG